MSGGPPRSPSCVRLDPAPHELDPAPYEIGTDQTDQARPAGFDVVSAPGRAPARDAGGSSFAAPIAGTGSGASAAPPVSRHVDPRAATG